MKIVIIQHIDARNIHNLLAYIKISTKKWLK